MKVAVFVDAGYLYALAGMARFRMIPPRSRLTLDLEAVLRQLKSEVAALDGGGNRLVRIYWYDGAPKSGMTPDQARTAASPDVKLRLGSVNNYGEQKGVDALIAHDLSELARNHAIDAAILVSGDEDILVGVQTAQSFGVRVHLLGIDPVRSQSQRLMYEADVCHEWPNGLVSPWITMKPVAGARTSASADDADAHGDTPPDMNAIIAAIHDVLDGREDEVVETWERDRRIAREIDSQLMKELSAFLGRTMTAHEKPVLRQTFIDTLRTSRGLDAPPATPARTSGGDAAGTGAGADASSERSAEHESDDAAVDHVDRPATQNGHPTTYARATSSPLTDEQIAGILRELWPAIRDRAPRILDTWERTKRLPVDVNVRFMNAAEALAGQTLEGATRIGVRNTFVALLAAAAEIEAERV